MSAIRSETTVEILEEAPLVAKYAIELFLSRRCGWRAHEVRAVEPVLAAWQGRRRRWLACASGGAPAMLTIEQQTRHARELLLGRLVYSDARRGWLERVARIAGPAALDEVVRELIMVSPRQMDRSPAICAKERVIVERVAQRVALTILGSDGRKEIDPDHLRALSTMLARAELEHDRYLGNRLVALYRHGHGKRALPMVRRQSPAHEAPLVPVRQRLVRSPDDRNRCSMATELSSMAGHVDLSDPREAQRHRLRSDAWIETFGTTGRAAAAMLGKQSMARCKDYLTAVAWQAIAAPAVEPLSDVAAWSETLVDRAREARGLLLDLIEPAEMVACAERWHRQIWRLDAALIERAIGRSTLDPSDSGLLCPLGTVGIVRAHNGVMITPVLDPVDLDDCADGSMPWGRVGGGLAGTVLRRTHIFRLSTPASSAASLLVLNEMTDADGAAIDLVHVMHRRSGNLVPCVEQLDAVEYLKSAWKRGAFRPDWRAIAARRDAIMARMVPVGLGLPVLGYDPRRADDRSLVDAFYADVLPERLRPREIEAGRELLTHLRRLADHALTSGRRHSCTGTSPCHDEAEPLRLRPAIPRAEDTGTSSGQPLDDAVAPASSSNAAIIGCAAWTDAPLLT